MHSVGIKERLKDAPSPVPGTGRGDGGGGGGVYKGERDRLGTSPQEDSRLLGKTAQITLTYKSTHNDKKC